MTDSQKNKVTAEKGELVYDKSFLCNFMCSLAFLNHIIADTVARKELFKYHLANKQVQYYDPQSQQIVKP